MLWMPGFLLLFTPFLLRLVVNCLLPCKAGAPGAAFLLIACECPQCQRPLSFARREEGFAALCPACSALLTVPGDAVGQAVGDLVIASGRADSQDPVPIFRSSLPELVELARQRVEAEGIPVFVADELIVHAHPGLFPMCGGARVIVSSEYADQARSILMASPAIELPSDADTGPVFPEETANDGVTQFLFEVLFLACILPEIIMPLWNGIVPHLFRGAVSHGLLPAVLEWKFVMRGVLILVLLRLSLKVAAAHLDKKDR